MNASYEPGTEARQIQVPAEAAVLFYQIAGILDSPVGDVIAEAATLMRRRVLDGAYKPTGTARRPRKQRRTEPTA